MQAKQHKPKYMSKQYYVSIQIRNKYINKRIYSIKDVSCMDTFMAITL